MKTILYKPAGRIQNAQWDLINYPPEGYRFVTKKSMVDGAVNNSFIFNNLRLQVLDRLFPLNLTKSSIEAIFRLSKPPSGIDLIYTYNNVSLEGVPWMVQVEWPHILIGRDLFWIRKQMLGIVKEELLKDSCKKIFTWTESARNAFQMYPTYLDIQKKTAVVPPAIRPKALNKSYDREGRPIRLLFVGSINDINDFEAKGGIYVLKVFEILKERGCNLKLHIRAKVPRYLKAEIGSGVVLLEDKLSNVQFEEVLVHSDILIHPSHLAHNHITIEAMSYGLPVVATYIGSTFGEYVEDGKTGFVVDSPPLKYFMDSILRSETTERPKLIKEAQVINKDVLEQLVFRTEQLVKDVGLRRRLGGEGKKAVDEGKFSISNRNRILKEVLDGVVR